jgi:hypothetical protein
MTDKSDTERVSRRRAFSILGLAALGLGLCPMVLMVSDAEAQQLSTQSPQTGTTTTPQTGTERRTGRTERRKMRRTERRQKRAGPPRPPRPIPSKAS